jgi:Immunity protein 53
MAEHQANPLRQLQLWYLARCDGDWEHSYGIRIETLDNPGWHLRIDLTNSRVADVTAERVERSEIDWIHWKVKDGQFDAACGPTNLGEAITTFLTLAGDAEGSPRSGLREPRQQP